MTTGRINQVTSLSAKAKPEGKNPLTSSTTAHGEGKLKAPQGVIETKNAEITKRARPENLAGCFLFGILVTFTTQPIVRSDSEIKRQGETRGFPKEHV
jgi:hypothetical protein